MSHVEKKILKELKPGEEALLSIPVHKDKEHGEIVIRYGDKYGNAYETRALVNLKEKKIIKQEFKIIKKVKDIPEDEMPNLVIDEESIF